LGGSRARAQVLAVAHQELPAHLANDTIVVPRGEPELDPILMGIPLQMLPITRLCCSVTTLTTRATSPRA